MLVSKEIDFSKGLTQEQIAMLDKMDKMPITFDEDSPELSEADLQKFRRVDGKRDRKMLKKQVTLDLPLWAARRAEALGSEYREILSRIIEDALRNKSEYKVSI